MIFLLRRRFHAVSSGQGLQSTVPVVALQHAINQRMNKCLTVNDDRSAHFTIAAGLALQRKWAAPDIAPTSPPYGHCCNFYGFHPEAGKMSGFTVFQAFV
jgi:hypothetical protein